MSLFTADIPVDPKGYEWINSGGYGPEDDQDHYEGSLELCWRSADELREQYRETSEVAFTNYYNPFVKEPALFRIFANLEVEPNAILKFANQYGDFATLWNMSEGVEYFLEDWRLAIDGMQEAVQQADEFIAAEESRRKRSKNTKAVIELVNEILGEAEIFLTASQQNGGIGLRMHAMNLLSAMRLQLVDAITEEKRYRKCEHCSKPFEVSPQVNRSDRMFCSDNCRVKAYYRRKQKAVTLREEGRSLREIAAEIGSDMQTLKSWLKDVDKKAK